MTWTALETNTHQDHLIAHVIDATPLGHFFWDETVYLLLDIGFIWIIYLDLQMGLVPHPVAITELEAEDTIKTDLRADIDQLLHGGNEISRMKLVEEASPILTVDLYESENMRQVVLNCEERQFVIETSLATGAVRMG